MKYFTVVLSFALSISACGNSSRESSGVEESLATGILAEDVTTSDLLDASIREITAAETVLINAKKTLFNLNSDGLAKKDGAS
ncbi:MAG: hypothetical protein R3204_13985, partial [Oceanospirillum sp.]|nr:hypothetical protein [Oceanospirillum sp.]